MDDVVVEAIVRLGSIATVSLNVAATTGDEFNAA